jgi:hypothetical protein
MAPAKEECRIRKINDTFIALWAGMESI